MYKLSIYNYSTNANGRTFIYNTLHRSFVAVEEKTWENIKISHFAGLAEAEIRSLLASGILVNENIDEKFVFEDIMQNACLQSDRLSVFLSMTSLCNLACPYCYQDCRKEQVSKTYISKRNIDIFCKYLRESAMKNIYIVYFGGEPTLDDKLLSYAINKVNSIDGKYIGNTLITNGYALSPMLIETIKSYPNFTVQITLDGNRTLHDSLRVTPASKPTYSTIMRNIHELVRTIPNQVNIRINVSSTDFTPYKELIDELYDTFAHKISIQFEAVFNGQKQINETGLTDTADILELFDYAKEKGYRSCPSIEYAPCIANTKNALVADEALNVYRCPSQLYEKQVGCITPDAKLNIYDNEWYQSVYNHKPCVYSCLYGGLCYGGCVMHKQKCRKELFDKLLPYVVSRKIETYFERKSKI